MINGNLDQFLDTGWYSESALFYNGHIYWCEAQFNEQNSENIFFVDKWCAINEEDKYYHSILNRDGTLDWERIYEDSDSDIDIIKKRFLEARLFEGHSFWDVESEIAWLDEAMPISTDDENV